MAQQLGTYSFEKVSAKKITDTAHLNFNIKSTLLKINQAWGQACVFAKLFQQCVVESSDVTDME